MANKGTRLSAHSLSSLGSDKTEREGLLSDSHSPEKDPPSPVRKCKSWQEVSANPWLNPKASKKVGFNVDIDSGHIKLEVKDLFCELSELKRFKGVEHEEWMETARWVKFEEVLELGGKRWSKPRVATLSYKYLKELKDILHNGSVILDLDGSNMLEISDMLAYRLLKTHLHGIDLQQVIEVFLRKHHHQHEKRSKKRPPTVDVNTPGGEPKSPNRSRANSLVGRRGSKGHNYSRNLTASLNHLTNSPSDNRTRTSSISKSLNSFRLASDTDEDGGIELETDADDLMADSEGEAEPESPPPQEGEEEEGEGEDGSPGLALSNLYKHNRNFLRKIPQGAEACNIFSGGVDFLTHPVCFLARLSNSTVLGDMTEVSLPTRFIFFLLGPKGGENPINYHELGRVMGTLMCDEVFKEVAYKARSKHDVVLAIDEFLSNTTLLPPSEWDPSIRIEPPQSVPSQARRRKVVRRQMKHSHSHQHLPEEQHSDSEDEAEHARDSGIGEESTLSRTGKLFGGLVQDVKRKIKFYVSDVKDALHIQCLATILFLYFACLTANVTFGGLLGISTDLHMANIENLVAAGFVGITYALFSGQPLTIMGSTGPMLVFEGVSYRFCKENGIDYLPFRFWEGMWTALILLTIVIFDLSALVRYITKFTEESFAMLISVIFIVEAVEKSIHILKKAPIELHTFSADYSQESCFCEYRPNVTQSNMTTMSSGFVLAVKRGCADFGGELIGDGCPDSPYVPDVFLFSILLFIGTFTIAMALKSFRGSGYLPSRVRSIVGDFAVPIAIAIMVTTDRIVDIKTPKLSVPTKFQPSIDRNWIVNPLGSNAWWTILAAAIPALLVSILIFMDQQITSVIVNRKENKLKKGCGYHLDVMVLTIQIAVCSVFGLPWMVAATVRSMTHINSLKMTSECSAPGEKPEFLGVREQRVTGFVIFVLMGLSVFMSTYLNYVPMPVLYGVFLYMGVSALFDKELVQRVLIVFMPNKYQPDYMFLRHVKTRRVHIFTLIQIVCLILLWIVKSVKAISIAFPLMVLLMCVVRKFLERIFNQRELFWLDDLLPGQKEAEGKKNEDATDVEGKDKLLDRGLSSDEEYGNEIVIKINEMNGNQGSKDTAEKEKEKETEANTKV
ncbi:sodium bicarbonate cotransporter 3 [Lingula anatina]|uniref:Anion exchange protein n=1 Tax=Lingula anatina TaxID=7574 RepID=A0A1S3HWF7_LINAN|nr:sodium bicarbonate cotransporter 3 [Lingula anatina]|eukprot:XP_013390370.1 sodium bicarbonate cotransporter 3 [Lingula anatina]